MADCTEVRVSSFGFRIRIDPEYYQSDYLHRLQTLARHKTFELGQIAMVTDGIHTSPKFQSGSGIYYLSAKCVRDCTFDLSDAEEISSDFNTKNKRTQLRKGDIIISTVGTIGFCAVVETDMLPANCDRHVGIVRIHNPDKYDPYYIAAFINSLYGRTQTIREATGNVQLNLFIYSILKLRIPFIDNYREIGQQVRKAIALRKKAQELYQSAQKILYEELGIEEINQSDTLTYTVSLTEILQARRWDTQCFHPRFLEYTKAIRKHGNFIPLNKLLFRSVKGLQQEDMANGGIAYASIKHISDFEMITASKASSFWASNKIARQGDLLLAITGATIGKIGIVERYKNLAFSGDLLRLRVTEPYNLDPYYLLVVLRSPLGQAQLLRWITGSTNGHLAPRDIQQVLIPRLEEKEQAISNNVCEALNARKESETILKNVKYQVEQLIENTYITTF